MKILPIAFKQTGNRNYYTNFKQNNSIQKPKVEHSALEINAIYNLAFCSTKIPIYIIDSTGEIKKFDSKAKAAAYIDPSKKSLSEEIKGQRVIQNNYCAIPASEIEIINRNGEIELKKDKIKEAVKKIRKNYIYGIKKDGSYKIYKTHVEAGKDINSPSSSIFASLSKGFCSKGNIFVPASEVENFDENCRIITDMSKIKELSKKAKQVLDYYLINADGSYKKFDTQIELAKYLGTKQTNISSILACNSIYKNSKIVYSEVVEKQNEKGELEVDINKIQEIAKSIRQTSNNLFYIVRADGSYKKYTDKKQAEIENGINGENLIVNILEGKIKKTKDYTFVRCDEIEKTSKKGKQIVDKAKLRQIVKNLRKNLIYLIDENGEFEIFKSQLQTAKAVGVSRTYINKILNDYEIYYLSRVKKYVCPANAIEIEDKNGNFVPDLTKLCKHKRK